MSVCACACVCVLSLAEANARPKYDRRESACVCVCVFYVCLDRDLQTFQIYNAPQHIAAATSCNMATRQKREKEKGRERRSGNSRNNRGGQGERGPAAAAANGTHENERPIEWARSLRIYFNKRPRRGKIKKQNKRHEPEFDESQMRYVR